jgi:biotin synthesis protein BioG
MQYKWLNCNKNKKLIVFFNGWGMDEKIVENLSCSNYDVLVFYDYRNLNIESFDFSIYEEKILIAWSMGVYVCNYFYDLFKNFDKFIAINGSLKPIDDEFGIPKMIYNLTVDNFNELSCSKFMKKISSSVDLKSYVTRNLDELKEELIFIRDLKINNYLEFNKVYISLKDRIFPPKNLINFWQNKNVEIVNLETGHYIFDKFKNWSDLV